MSTYKQPDDFNLFTSKIKGYWDLEKVLDLEGSYEEFKRKGVDKEIEKALLKDVQANILKSTRHKYTLYCFLTFKSKVAKSEIVSWLKNIPLTSTWDQIDRRNNKPQNQPAISLSLSFEGYEFICDPKKIEDRIPLADDDIISFREGLSAKCYKVFGGKKRRFIENNYQKPAHALILIGSDSPLLAKLNQESNRNKQYKALFDFFVRVTADKRKSFDKEYGEVFFEIGLKNPDNSSNTPQEWFGFKDGISNPRFFPKEGLEKILGYPPEKPSTLRTVLRRNDLSPKPYACGSFLVFLKLEQQLDNFEKYVNHLAKKLDLEDADQAAAYIIGRKKNGTPLHKTFGDKEGERRNLNDFDFKDDSEGLTCPMHAHIRKVNPRDGLHRQRIVRRGRLYGDETKKAGKKGLLFLSYQSSLRHFEDIINLGLYSYNHKNKNVGQDLLITEGGEYHNAHKYVNAAGALIHPYLRAKQFSKFRGGQYFFTSSISFIKVNLENCM